ncbi:MAG: transcriptional regulator [Delftia acidovorans]|nr:MAG: transcriptional regulator [Delftia acidovorans]
MEINASIGARLKEVREELGLSQTEFAQIAEKAGVPGATRQSQAKYEKGLAAPSAAYLATIAAAGADVLYILTGQRIQQPVSETELTPRQRALLDNHEHSDEDGKKVIEGAAVLAAKSQGTAPGAGRVKSTKAA